MTYGEERDSQERIQFRAMDHEGEGVQGVHAGDNIESKKRHHAWKDSVLHT